MNITLEMPFESVKQDLKFLLEFRGEIALGYAVGMYDTDGKKLLWGPLQGSNSDLQNIYPLSPPLADNKNRYIKVNFSYEALGVPDLTKYSITLKLQQEGLTISEKNIAADKMTAPSEKIRLLIKLI